jgi:hypothetical protein
VVAGSVLACAVGALPFAGGAADRLDAVTTVGGEVSTAPAPTTTTLPELVEVVAPAAAPQATAVVVESAPPPPPPPPDGAEPDPSVGFVVGDDAPPGAPVVVTPVSAAPAASPVVDDARAPERVWAVVVGIDDYPGRASDLNAARADAADLVTALLGYGVPGDHVLPLYDGAATVASVLDAVDWLVSRAGPEDTAVFLFAGHVRDLGGGTEAMVTADAGWLTDWFLADRFAALRSRDAWFVVAGCYGGGFDELLGPGRVLTAGAGPGELAYENDQYGRSYLAEFVLRRGLLEGAAGAPTVQAAVAYAADQLAELHPNRQLWHVDEAGHTISLDGRRRDGSAPPAEAPPPPQPPPPNLLAAIVDDDCLLGFLGTCR